MEKVNFNQKDKNNQDNLREISEQKKQLKEQDDQLEDQEEILLNKQGEENGQQIEKKENRIENIQQNDQVLENQELIKKQEDLKQENKEKNKDKEKKEGIEFDELLKAAEILCYLNLKDKSSLKEEKLKEIISKMQQEHSLTVIKQAAKVAILREKGLNLAEEIYQISKRENKSSSDYAKEESLREELNQQLKERDNFYFKEIIFLKKLLLEEKNGKLKQEIENNPALANLTKEEKLEDLKNKMKSYDLFLTKLVLAELERNNEFKEKIENLKRKESFFYNLILKFNKLPRTTKAFIGSMFVGGVTAVFAPSMILTTLPLYFVYRSGRAVFGSALAGVFQKFFGKVVEKAYQGDYKRLGEEFSKFLLGEKEAKNKILKDKDLEILFKQGKEIDYLIQQGDFARLADLNFQIALEQQERIKNLKKQRKVNYIASSLAMGLLGGCIGAQVFDYLFGPKFITPVTFKNNNSEGIITQKSSNLDLATIRKGEGIEHVLKRQLLNDPQKFGWDQKTDLNIWANKTAHLIAIKNGYVNPITGEEVRVYDMSFKGQQNPAYLLEVKDGQYRVTEYFAGEEIGGGSSQLNVYEYQYKNNLVNQNLENQNLITGKSSFQEIPIEQSDYRGVEKDIFGNIVNQNNNLLKDHIINLDNIFDLNQEQLVLYNNLINFFNDKVKNLFFSLKNVKMLEILNNLNSNYYNPKVKEVLSIFNDIPISDVEKNYTFEQYLKYQVLNRDLSALIKKIL